MRTSRLSLSLLILAGALSAAEWQGTIPGTSRPVYVPDTSKPIRAFINGGLNWDVWKAFAQRWNCAITEPDGNAEDAANEVATVQAKMDGLATALGKPECRWLPLVATGLSASSALANDLLRRWDAAKPGRCIASVQYHELDRIEEFPRYLPPPGVPHLVLSASGDGFYNPGPMAWAASDLVASFGRPATLCYQPQTGHAELGDSSFAMRWLERMMEQRLPAVPAVSAATVVPIPSWQNRQDWRGTFDLDIAAGDSTGWSYVGKMGNFYPYLIPSPFAPFGSNLEEAKPTTGPLRLGDARIGAAGSLPAADGRTWLADQPLAEAWLTWCEDATIQPRLAAATPPASEPGLHRQRWNGGPSSWEALWTTSPAATTTVASVEQLAGDGLGWYRWIGWIQAPTAGGYAFRLIGGGGLTIDDRRVITPDAQGGAGAVALAAGWHRVCIAFRLIDDSDPVEFFWRPPGAGSGGYVPVPAARFARATAGIQTANTAPSVTAPQGVQMPVNPAHISRLVWCRDRETPPASLTLTAASSNPTLIASTAVTITGSGSERRVTVRPAAGQSGTATITLTVSDGALTGQSAFTVAIGGGGAPPDTTPPAAPGGLTATVVP